MKSFSKNIAAAITILLMAALVFSFFMAGGTKSSALTMNDLVAKINAGTVTKIDVSGNDLTITLKDGTTATATKETETGLTDTLKNYGVDPVALRQVPLEVKAESGTQFWLGILVPTLLPLLILIGFFWFMMKGAKGGQSQIMNFG